MLGYRLHSFLTLLSRFLSILFMSAALLFALQNHSSLLIFIITSLRFLFPSLLKFSFTTTDFLISFRFLLLHLRPSRHLLMRFLLASILIHRTVLFQPVPPPVEQSLFLLKSLAYPFLLGIIVFERINLLVLSVSLLIVILSIQSYPPKL